MRVTGRTVKAARLFAPMSQLSDNEYLFTSESVTEGHPDKIADQISDGVLDAVLRDDPNGRVACETLVNTGLVVVSGEISTTTYVDIQEIARETIRKIGYVDADLGFSADSCAVLNAIDKQSPDIAQGVDQALERRTDATDDDELDIAGAGDQGMMFGYASQRDRRADAAADLARAQARRAPGRRSARTARWTTCARTARPRSPSATRRQAGRDREGPDLHPAPGGRRVADPGRPLGARRRARSCRPTSTTRRSCARTSWSTRPGASSSAARSATRASPAARSSSTPTAAWPATAAAPSRARTRRRSTARPPTPRATWPRTSSPPAWPTAARSRSRTRSASRTRSR